ncbi:hypothetical protein F5B18DRAFT_657929 [Nemania serpens]|nr:hypothetical protein F5B18DRAFT_657929 [Nemania serpens]
MQALTPPPPPGYYVQRHSDVNAYELKCLKLMAHDQPNTWVCEACMELHEATPDDTPHSYLDTRISCPLGRMEWGKRVYASWTACRFDPRIIFQLDHRHVQLALKYLRLKDASHRAHFKALTMTPYPQNYEASLSPTPDLMAPDTLYTPTPKIVSVDGQPRFLVKSVWSFQPHVFEPLNWDTLRNVWVCPHLYRAVCGSYEVNKTPLNRAFGVARFAAYFGIQHTFSCDHCPTEYSIRFGKSDVEVHAWQDFGPETCPTDVAWRSHCYCPWSLESTPGGVLSAPPAHHDVGRIQRWYEELPAEVF